MNRADLQRLSTIRMREAEVLFKAGEFSGAYYLAGYAVEYGLKARFAKGVKRYDFPDKAGAGKVFTHSLIQLLSLAELKKDLEATARANPRFLARWALVCRWTEESRYASWTKDDAEAILDAIGKRKDGVLPWIRQRW